MNRDKLDDKLCRIIIVVGAFLIGVAVGVMVMLPRVGIRSDMIAYARRFVELRQSLPVVERLRIEKIDAECRELTLRKRICEALAGVDDTWEDPKDR